MHPILIDFGRFTIHTYGLFVAAGFLAGMAWTMRELRQRGLNPEHVPDLALYVIFGAILGARLLYVFLNPGHFIENPLQIFMFWKGGLVFSGGAALGGFLGWWRGRKLKLSVRPWLDSVAPAIGLGQAIGRLGCLFAGCCYGRPTDLPLGITFTDLNSLAKPLGVPLHPTQIYHSLAGLLTFLILILAKRWLKRPGQIMGLLLILFPFFRISVEFFRADFRGEILLFSATQVTTALFLIPGIYLLAGNNKEKSK